VALRACRVSVTDLEGTTHSVSVKASTLFEAAAEAIGTFRREQWAAHALTENAVLRHEVQAPAVIHDVPLKAVERWRNGPSASPREYSAKRRLRDT
jgi:methionine salvage enolase-phosphatase E1